MGGGGVEEVNALSPRSHRRFAFLATGNTLHHKLSLIRTALLAYCHTLHLPCPACALLSATACRLNQTGNHPYRSQRRPSVKHHHGIYQARSLTNPRPDHKATQPSLHSLSPQLHHKRPLYLAQVPHSLCVKTPSFHSLQPIL
jgi:hypothetical protein